MTDIAWQLFVNGLLLYGLVFMGIVPVVGLGGVRRLKSPDHQDAPIFVTRRERRPAARAMSRTGTTRTSRGLM